MKKTFKTIALLSMTGLMAISCQKEPIVEPQATIETTPYEHRVIYTLDGMDYQISFSSDEEWLLYLDHLIALAESGRSVGFRRAETRVSTKQTREIVTYTTNNRKDADAWAASMEDNGYEVSITYDKKTGIYTCTAIK